MDCRRCCCACDLMLSRVKDLRILDPGQPRRGQSEPRRRGRVLRPAAGNQGGLRLGGASVRPPRPWPFAPSPTRVFGHGACCRRCPTRTPARATSSTPGLCRRGRRLG
jgi:hypothetical protein